MTGIELCPILATHLTKIISSSPASLLYSGNVLILTPLSVLLTLRLLLLRPSAPAAAAPWAFVLLAVPALLLELGGVPASSSAVSGLVWDWERVLLIAKDGSIGNRLGKIRFRFPH